MSGNTGSASPSSRCGQRTPFAPVFGLRQELVDAGPSTYLALDMGGEVALWQPKR